MRKQDEQELGTTGLKIYSGIVDEEFLPQLRGRKALRVYEQMSSNDPTVGAVLFAVEMLMRQVPWRVEPAGEQPIDLEKAAFLESCRDDMSESWTDTLAGVLSFLVYGFSLHEIVYKKRVGGLGSNHDDGRFGWSKLPGRAQETLERWDFDDDQRELEAVRQRALPRYEEIIIPEPRFLLFRTTTKKGNPEGQSVLRTAYRPWYFKKSMEEIEAIGIERDLAGLPVMKVPAEMMSPNATPDQVAILADLKVLIRNIRRDEKEGVIFPVQYDKEGRELYSFELMTSGGRRQHDTTKIIRRYETQIAMSVLADFIMLGHEKVGSFALASSKTNLFSVALGAWLDSIAGIFNRTAVPRLFAVNAFGPTDKLPQLMHADIETVDLGEMGEYVSKLAGAGARFFPDRELENVLRGHANLPELPPDEELEEETVEPDETVEVPGTVIPGQSPEDQAAELDPEADA